MSQSTISDLSNEEIEERVIGIDEIMMRLNEHCSSNSEEEKLEICECLKVLNESKPIDDNEQYVAHDDESEDDDDDKSEMMKKYEIDDDDDNDDDEDDDDNEDIDFSNFQREAPKLIQRENELLQNDDSEDIEEDENDFMVKEDDDNDSEDVDNEIESEEEEEDNKDKEEDEIVDDDDNDEDSKELIVNYEVRDVSNNEKELIREIVFDVDSDIDSIWYLQWCAVDNDKSYCSKQSFSKSESIKTSILTNIGYDFVIIDEHNLYEWKLANFNDVQPDKGLFYS